MTSPVYVALDTTETGRAAALAKMVAPYVGGVKIGLEFFLAHGHKGYEILAKTGLPIFLDLKLHDIPNTVKGALQAVLPLEPTLLTVHAAGGPAMIAAAREAAETFATSRQRTKIIAVSVLTSLDDNDLEKTGIKAKTEDQVATLARLAYDAGADGLVCSPREIKISRQVMGPHAVLVVPGIRPLGVVSQDQKRVMTPREAKLEGADILVIGRAITNAVDPGEAAWAIGIDL